MPIKNTLTFPLAPIRMTKINKTNDKIFYQRLGKGENHFIAGRSTNWHTLYRNGYKSYSE